MTDAMRKLSLVRANFANPCNPYHAEVIAALLDALPRPILQGQHDLTDTVSDQMASLQKTAREKARTHGRDADDWSVILGSQAFAIREKLGEGAFGAVFRLAHPLVVDGGEAAVAVKVERPTNVWEFCVLDQLQQRLAPRARSSVVRSHGLYAYQDESFLLLDYCEQGSLLDAVNKANESGVAPATGGITGLEEIVAMFFMIEVLRTLEDFHSKGFIHGDLKIDNCLMRIEDSEGKDWSGGCRCPVVPHVCSLVSRSTL